MLSDDRDKCQIAINKAVDFARAFGTRPQYSRALELQLPTSPVYNYLEGRIPHPSHTYKRLAEIVEAEETEKINKEIGERRTRIGARIAQVTAEVKREVYGKSELEEIYQHIVEWENEDEVRREYEEKLLQRAYDTLVVLPLDAKTTKREQVVKLAHGMVIIKHPFALAWEIELEWHDAESLRDFDANVVREYVAFFPYKGLSKVLRGYLTGDNSPFPLELEHGEHADHDEEGGGVTLNGDTAVGAPTSEDKNMSAEDRLVLMTEGLQDTNESALAHRLMGDYYLQLEEYEVAIDTIRKGLKRVAIETQRSGLKLQNVQDAMNNTLASALVYYQAPRNHQEAKTLFDSMLKRKPTFTPALIGVGLIYEEDEEFDQAIEFLGRALERDPSNSRIGAEAAWCKALNGSHAIALQELEEYFERMSPKDAKLQELRALTLYRIGMCMWELDPSKAARKDRAGPYSKFLTAIKNNPNLAPAYASLGFYYADYAKDKKRARQCFQKAFELSPSEVEAAERLARSFAAQGDWDIVEVIASRVIDSGRARPPPGSKRKGISWPYSALGVVQMNRQEYSKSVISFLAALRISPDDYHAYVGLGESYHNSGRYNSAARTFQYAEDPNKSMKGRDKEYTWFTDYMLANVNRELGEYDDAVDVYQTVLVTRPDEFGVAIDLLQTLVDRAWRRIETGFFGQAAESAREVIMMAERVAKNNPNAFNLWKAVGDACTVYSWVQSSATDAPLEDVAKLLATSVDKDVYDLFADIDGIGQDALAGLASSGDDSSLGLRRCISASVLAYKRAIHSCSSDIHAQAVSWYNLGWAQERAHACLERSVDPESMSPVNNVHIKAAMRCFKRAIELEAGNAEFWNALGVVTTKLNPKVAQHAFVRSLHLNERSAKVWTNLGTLYLLNNDLDLAHQAFTRAQSTDPDYAHAWLGAGLLALLWGEPKEALMHFTHAFEISDAFSFIVKRQYAVSTFDRLLEPPASASNDITFLIQPLFALQQLQSQTPSNIPFRHLTALYLERVGSYQEAIAALEDVCSAAEQEYEETESQMSLVHFAEAKADLSRNRLAVGDFDAAVEDAETALDLTSDIKGATKHSVRPLRLAAHLSAGLCRYFLNAFDASITMFRSALEESGSAPDVVNLLATVLWAKGGEEEKTVAREQLYGAIEKHTDEISSAVLLGVMAVLDGDTDAMDAVKDDLRSARTQPNLDTKSLQSLEQILDAIVTVTSTPDRNSAAQEEISISIMLAPHKPYGWTQLAKTTDESYPAEMALLTAARSVPPNGGLSAEDLAATHAGAGSAANAQRAVVLAPWCAEGWASLEEAVTGKSE